MLIRCDVVALLVIAMLKIIAQLCKSELLNCMARHFLKNSAIHASKESLRASLQYIKW